VIKNDGDNPTLQIMIQIVTMILKENKMVEKKNDKDFFVSFLEN